jgi:hypothetical protein
MRKVYWIIFKNNTKRYFKDWRKIAVFFIIFILVFFYALSFPKVVLCAIPACSQSEWINLHWKFCPTCYLTISDYISGIIYYTIFPMNLLDYYFTKSTDALALTFFLVIQVLYWYLLSCLIVWIYDRLWRTLKSKNSKL